MYRYLLLLRDGAPNDPAVLVTGISRWSVGEVITLGVDDRLRIAAIVTPVPNQLVRHGFSGVFAVEPV